MSLTQRVEPRVAPGGTTAGASAEQRKPFDFKSLPRRAATPVVAEPAVVTSSLERNRGSVTEPARPALRSPDVAFTLLEQAASALPSLLVHCQKIEDELAAARATLVKERDAAERQARESGQALAAMRLKVDSLEIAIANLRGRSEAAEAKANNARDAVEKTQHQAAAAECLSSLFHDKVVTAFGIGSPAHAALEALKVRGVVPSVAIA